MAKKYHAHSLEGEPKEKWQKLKDHLAKVGEMVSETHRRTDEY